MKSANSLSNSGKAAEGIISPNPSSEKGAGGDFLLQNVRSSSDDAATPKNEIQPQKTVVLGIGNVLLSDEGIGVHVANELMKMEMPPGVSVVEGGTDGFSLLNIITDADRLIVVDAVKGGAEPGTIYRFNANEIQSVPSGFKTSVHQIGILEVIDLSALIGKTPKTSVIGIEPKSFEMSLELSPEIRAKVPRIIELVFEELNKA
jgi:hydrogenase maturation protease